MLSKLEKIATPVINKLIAKITPYPYIQSSVHIINTKKILPNLFKQCFTKLYYIYIAIIQHFA